MPQARRTGSRSTGSKPSSGSTSKAKSGATSAKRSTAAKSGATSAKRSTAAKSAGAAAKPAGTAAKRTSAASTKASTSAKAKPNAADARLEAVAERLRKLNERIIDAGREAGETTLSSYEKALKAIATSIERGPGSSDVDWIAHLATTQAKFIRDLTSAWTSAARGVLK
ncbi:MAG TPA: hypothetical protein VG275_01725 [Solirubrobacteraceae bacterium]|nr:hypothetical protein [Solirubrobacteraceae bacterium]